MRIGKYSQIDGLGFAVVNLKSGSNLSPYQGRGQNNAEKPFAC
jgi:hypothetical protein